MKIVFMFSGQGAQYYHMGAKLYACNEVFREQMDAMDQTLMKRWGCSVLASMYGQHRRKVDCFDHTVLSSLAIFMVERALSETLAHYGCHPDRVLGVSIGAFAAVCAGGMASHQEMLEAVVRYGEVVEHRCVEGTMYAILAPSALYGDNPELAKSSEIAAINADSHFVISLPRTEVAGLEAFLENRKVLFQRMPVSRAYHSRWISAAREEFSAVFERLSYIQGRIPINLCWSETNTFSVSTGALWNAIRERIRFREAVQHMEQEEPHHYIDVGTSGTLATLLKYVLPAGSRSCVHSILTPLGGCDRNLQNVLLAIRSKRIAGRFGIKF
jgi:bacillaene synthase trans-acting acyltransferase